MKKILLVSCVIAALTSSLYARIPPYKTSLGFHGGLNKVNDKKVKSAGLSFKMEEKIKHSRLYYGVGSDITFNQKDTITTIGLYPTLSVNFNRKLSIGGFAGLSYGNRRHPEFKKFGYTYGGGFDYSLGAGSTNGFFFKADVIKKGKEEIKTKGIYYRIALKF